MVIIDKLGEGSIDPPVGIHSFLDGEEITVVATPSETYHFVAWTGSITESDPVLTITVSEPLMIIARFASDAEDGIGATGAD